MNLNNTNIIFPILVQKYTYSKHDEFKLFLTDYIKYKIKTFNGDWNNVTTVFQKDGDKKLLSSFLKQPEKEVKEFREFCEEKCLHYASEILQYDIEKMLVTDSWINIYEKLDSVQKPHYHANSFLCGNYFLNYTDKHSPLCFLSPYSSLNQNLSSIVKINKKKEVNPLNAGESHIFCDEGQILFWPSFLYHFVPASETIGRSTISMNFMPNKILNEMYGFEIKSLD